MSSAVHVMRTCMGCRGFRSLFTSPLIRALKVQYFFHLYFCSSSYFSSHLMLINLCRYRHFLETCCFSSDAGTPAASVMIARDAPCCWGGRDFYSFHWLLARRGNCRLDAFRESSRVLRSPLVCNMPMALL